jgi:hypothetical protein
VKIYYILFTILFSLKTIAYSEKSFSAGLGYFSGASFGKLTKNDVGSTSTLGTTEYPLIFKFDKNAYKDIFVSSRLGYTLLARSGSASTTSTTTIHLYFPLGKNIQSTSFDWGVGPGLLRRTIKGSGGTTELSNGNSTATFAVPGRAVTTQTISMNFSTTYTKDQFMFGFDLITEGLLSNKERTLSPMLSFTYNFMSSRGRK